MVSLDKIGRTGKDSQRHFQVPLIRLVLFLIFIGIMCLAVGCSNESTPTVQSGQQEGNIQEESPPIQAEPSIAASIIPTIELKWTEIGTAQNGDKVLALPIPWDQLVTEVTPDNRAMFVKIENLNHPLGYEQPGVLIGYLLENDRITIYGYASQDPHTLSYWKAESTLSEIKGLLP